MKITCLKGPPSNIDIRNCFCRPVNAITQLVADYDNFSFRPNEGIVGVKVYVDENMQTNQIFFEIGEVITPSKK